MKTVWLVTTCAWCKWTIEIRSGVEVSDATPVREVRVDYGPGHPDNCGYGCYHEQTLDAAESHGCCSECRATMLAPLRAQPTAQVCVHGKAPGEWCTGCEAES